MGLHNLSDDRESLTLVWERLQFSGISHKHDRHRAVEPVYDPYIHVFLSRLALRLALHSLGIVPIRVALYSNERRYATKTAIAILLLFITGVLINYFILFPISFRFLGTYSVSETVVSNITIDSYISTFVSLTLVLGIVFQLPVLAFFLGKMGVISSQMLSRYRKHSLIIIMLVAAIITPPDVMTLVLVTIPLYLLFELSIKVLKWTEKRKKENR